MIKNLWKEDDRVKKAMLDEQQLKELEFSLQRAFSESFPIEVKYHNGFDYSFKKVKVMRVDANTRKIHCKNIDAD